MTRQCMFFFLWVAFSSNATDAFASAWPRLDNKSSSQCTEALQIAKVMYESDEFSLFAPPIIPANLPSVIVLRPKRLDISGGDELEANEAIFDKLPRGGEGAPRSIYWQKNAINGLRLVVVESSFGWRGDTYSLFVIEPESGSNQFLAEIRSENTTRKFSPIIPDSWRPPLIFQERGSGQSWFIDVGQPYEFLADWHVHVSEPSGLKHRCTIQFRPNVKKAITLLPKPVRELARLLDQTIGRGDNEGTLQPTARLRLDVEHTWANAAQRPWVLEAPYNTRQEVDDGLKSWSQKGMAYRKVYQAIQRQYPTAERSLADYYQRNFGRSAAEAWKLSAYIIDIAFRSHYVFHSDDQNRYFSDKPSRNNPWKKP